MAVTFILKGNFTQLFCICTSMWQKENWIFQLLFWMICMMKNTILISYLVACFDGEVLPAINQTIKITSIDMI